MLKFKKNIFFLFLLVVTASQLVRCGHSGKKSNLRLEQSYLVSDDNGLIRTLPNKITLIEDSVFRFLFPPDKFLEYNIKTKKLNVLLDKIDFNIDSLISITYQPLNIHKYRYYHHSDKDLKNYDHNLFVLSQLRISDQTSSRFPLIASVNNEPDAFCSFIFRMQHHSNETHESSLRRTIERLELENYLKLRQLTSNNNNK